MQGPSLEIQWSQVTWWLRTCLAMEKICRFDPWSGNSDPTYHRATTDPTCHSERFLMMKQRLHVLQLRHNTAKYIHTYCLKKKINALHAQNLFSEICDRCSSEETSQQTLLQ